MTPFRRRVLVKRLLKWGLGTLWLPVALLWRRRGIRILCYHKVDDASDNKLSVLTHRFTRQMAYLARSYRVISLSEATDLLRSGRSIPRRTVVLTFDDGYRSALENAVPRLKEYGFLATFFITPNLVGSPHGFPHDAGFEAFDNGVAEWFELEKLVRTGMAVGAHSLTHRILAVLPAAEQREEIEGPRRIIEERLGVRVTAYSYPSGSRLDFDVTSRNLAEGAGYTSACTTINGVNGAGRDLFELRRTNVLNEDDMLLFRYILWGALDWLAFKDSRPGRAVQRWFRRRFGY
jgi:peptidoglycan/xylan/chitin deacetylase (PgdA/CDA1 family)